MKSEKEFWEAFKPLKKELHIATLKKDGVEVIRILDVMLEHELITKDWYKKELSLINDAFNSGQLVKDKLKQVSDKQRNKFINLIKKFKR